VFFENNYIKPNRRFILGTVAYHTPVRKWTFEFWEGDMIPPEQIKLTSDVINRTFFTPVAYKPNSLRQEQASATIAGLARVLQTEILRGQDYQALNVAKGIGRIHVIQKVDDHVEIGSNEILVLDESRFTCRRSPASSPASLQRRYRTSIYSQRAGAFRTLTSRMRTSF